MAYIFLDESGDLGFDFKKQGTSDYFVITFLFARDKKPVEKLVKKIHSGLRKKFKSKKSILHAYRERSTTRQRLLSKLAQKDVMILAVFLNKRKVRVHLHDQKAVLYNYVTNILLDRIFAKKILPINEKILLIASKKETNKFLNENFSRYLKSQLSKNHALDLEIQIKTPPEEKSLQAVDFVSWAIFRKYQHKDESYYKLIKKIIFEENGLFP